MNIINKHKKLFLAFIVGIAVLISLIVTRHIYEINSPSTVNPIFITANPVDLSQIKSISTFRSCVGHDYSAENTEGEEEKLRTMKHYLDPINELVNSKGKIKVFAPFDGEITSINNDKGPQQAQRGVQVWLEPESANGWNFLFFHIDLLEHLKDGSEINSGDLIGYADLTDAANFDIVVKNFEIFRGKNVIDAPLLHMTDAVLAEYEIYGATKENMILSKSYRDENPCKIIPGTESKHDTFFDSAGERDTDWVILKETN